MRNQKCLILITMSMLLVGCDRIEESAVLDSYVNQTKTQIEEEEQTDITEEIPNGDNADIVLYEERNDYSYPNEFLLQDNLKGAIEQMCLCYSDFNEDDIYDDNYEDIFENSFLLNSRYGFDYLYEITSENNGLITREQAEYVQYSLTGVYLSLEDMDDAELDYYKASSGYCNAELTSYEVTEEDDNYIKLDAQLEITYGSSETVSNWEASVELSRNPKSCFDGYSIKTLNVKDVTPVKMGDNEEHYFIGGYASFYDNEVIFEYYDSDDCVEYDHFVNADLSSTPELADYIGENPDLKFKVYYIFGEDMTMPVTDVIATKTAYFVLFVNNLANHGVEGDELSELQYFINEVIKTDDGKNYELGNFYAQCYFEIMAAYTKEILDIEKNNIFDTIPSDASIDDESATGAANIQSISEERWAQYGGIEEVAKLYAIPPMTKHVNAYVESSLFDMVNTDNLLEVNKAYTKMLSSKGKAILNCLADIGIALGGETAAAGIALKTFINAADNSTSKVVLNGTKTVDKWVTTSSACQDYELLTGNVKYVSTAGTFACDGIDYLSADKTYEKSIKSIKEDITASTMGSEIIVSIGGETTILEKGIYDARTIISLNEIQEKGLIELDEKKELEDYINYLNQNYLTFKDGVEKNPELKGRAGEVYDCIRMLLYGNDWDNDGVIDYETPMDEIDELVLAEAISLIDSERELDISGYIFRED